MKTFGTQRRQGAKKKDNSQDLSACASLRETSPSQSKRRRFVRHSVGDAFDAMLNEVLTEIDEQPEAFVHQPQIGEHLLAVDRVERCDRFHFHEDAIIDDQIRTEPFIERDPIPYDWNRHLSFDEVAVFAQVVCEGNFVHDLENARTKPALEPAGSIDDACSDFIFFHTPSLSFPVHAAKPKITRRRQGAKENDKSPPLSAFASLRAFSRPDSQSGDDTATEVMPAIK